MIGNEQCWTHHLQSITVKRASVLAGMGSDPHGLQYSLSMVFFGP